MKATLTLVLTKTIKGDDLDKVAEEEQEKVRAAVEGAGFKLELDNIEELDDDEDGEEGEDGDDTEETKTPND